MAFQNSNEQVPSADELAPVLHGGADIPELEPEPEPEAQGALALAYDSSPALQEPAPARDRQLMASHTRLRTPRVLPDGLRFGKYQVSRLIGVGGMSEVYEALHLGLRKRVALKVLKPDFAENEEARTRFVTEGIHAARIRHTNIVDVTDVGIVYQLPFLVMALLEGEDLGALYDRQGKLPVSDVIDVLLPVASAVAVGHEQGVVHRDLKPDNVFLHCEGARIIPKVLDFGVSRSLSGRRITLNASVFGTPHYMSPEQARGASTDERTDQYSLGVMIYEGVTGRLPRDSQNPIELLHSVAFDEFTPPTGELGLPTELEAVILRAMAQDPEDRFPTMHDLALSLVPFASEASREYWALELSDDGPKRPSLIVRPATRHSRPPGEEPPAPPAAYGGEQAAVEATQLAEYGHPYARDSQFAVVHRSGRASLVAWGILASAALAGATTAYVVQHVSKPVTSPVLLPVEAPSARTFAVEVQATPPTAMLSLDGQPIGTGQYKGQVDKDGTLHELQVSAEGYVPERITFRDQPPDRLVELKPSQSGEIATPPAPTPIATAPGSRPRTSASRYAKPEGARGTTHAASSAHPESAEPGDSAVAARPRIDVLDAQRPKVRLVDELAPRVQVIE